MATIDPVTALDGIAPLTSLSHLIDHKPMQQLDLDSPEGMKKTIGLLVDQIRKISLAVDLSNFNFETLYTNDGNLNAALSTLSVDGGTATMLAGTASVTVTLNLTSTNSTYPCVGIWDEDTAIRLYFDTRTTTSFVARGSGSVVSDRTFFWMALLT